MHPKKQIYQIKLEICTIVYSVSGFGVQFNFTDKLIFEKGVPVSKSTDETTIIAIVRLYFVEKSQKL